MEVNLSIQVNLESKNKYASMRKKKNDLEVGENLQILENCSP